MTMGQTTIHSQNHTDSHLLATTYECDTDCHLIQGYPTRRPRARSGPQPKFMSLSKA